ncbi:MAG: hypothetical protein KDJ36_06660 [Hyphomicrobiaceae bacterium]|nr:hypothetical protein [Hyphomicrobiaceae bacterium]
MELITSGRLTTSAGLEGDHKGAKLSRRQVTILAREDWEAALAELRDLAGEVPLPWTARRANLLVENVRLPRAVGARIAVGEAELEVTAQTVPCARMDEAHPGLLKALYPYWRGGVSCRVLNDGLISIGAQVSVRSSPPEHTRRLPG